MTANAHFRQLHTFSCNITNVFVRKLELIFLIIAFGFSGIQKGRAFQRPPDPGFHQPHYSDVDNDEHCIEWDRLDDMIAETDQVEPSNTCPFIDWKALESIDDDVDENSRDSASNDDISASANKRRKVVLYSDNSDTDN